MRSPQLSFELEARWLVVRDAYGTKYHKAKKLKIDCNIGAMFINEINMALEKLVEHYSGKSKYNADGKKGGDPEAFNRFFHETATSFPWAATSATL